MTALISFAITAAALLLFRSIIYRIDRIKQEREEREYCEKVEQQDRRRESERLAKQKADKEKYLAHLAEEQEFLARKLACYRPPVERTVFIRGGSM